ncbi:hypothetical protein BDV19DRAFT_362113 [Aspergillus venezuelensis]
MPTSTSTLGWTLANLGPAPTALTFPSSCTTIDYEVASTDYPEVAYWYNYCNPDYFAAYGSTECYAQPTDTAIGSSYSTNGHIIPFYSPGPSCPSGYKTVGAIAHQTGSGQAPISTSGIFNEDPYERFESPFPYGFGIQDTFAALLDPGETVIACCPESMTVGPLGGCYSALPDITPSTGCFYEYSTASSDETAEITTTTFPLNGTMTSGSILISPTVRSGDYIVTTTTFDDEDRETMMAVTMDGPYYFVHKPTDLTNKASETGSAGEETGTNAAVAVRLGQGSWGQIGGIVGVLGVSVLAGMALVLPW